MRKVRYLLVCARAQKPAATLGPGREFPGKYAELRAWFPNSGAHVDYLEWLWWPEDEAATGLGPPLSQ